MNRILPCAAVLAATLLAGCGGGGGDTMPAPTDNGVPASATTSPEAFVRYAAALAPSERGLPLDVSGLQPPTSETGEPVPLVR